MRNKCAVGMVQVPHDHEERQKEWWVVVEVVPPARALAIMPHPMNPSFVSASMPRFFFLEYREN